MSQEDVIKALEDQENGLSAEELAEIIKINTTAIRKCLNRLLKRHEVKRIKLNKKEVEELEKSFSGRHYRWVLENE